VSLEPPFLPPAWAYRCDQLSDLATACRRLASLLMIRGEVPAARLYAARAVRAEELLAHGFAQPDLDVLATAFPAEPAWILEPEGRAPWQDEVARVHGIALEAAEVLRT
jgi:hypothetical protein